jgi:hypothetical protein
LERTGRVLHFGTSYWSQQIPPAGPLDETAPLV